MVELLVYIVINRLLEDNRLPKAILLDRDKLFILNSKKGLTRRLDIKLRILNIYYLLIDG